MHKPRHLGTEMQTLHPGSERSIIMLLQVQEHIYHTINRNSILTLLILPYQIATSVWSGFLLHITTFWQYNLALVKFP